MGVPPAPPGAAALGVGGGGAMRVAIPDSAKQAEKAQASRNSCGSSVRLASRPAKDCTNFSPRSATYSGPCAVMGQLGRAVSGFPGRMHFMADPNLWEMGGAACRRSKPSTPPSADAPHSQAMLLGCTRAQELR